MDNILTVSQVYANTIRAFLLIISVFLFNTTAFSQDKADKMFDKALNLMQKDKVEKAEKQLLELLDIYPNYLNAYQALAEIYYVRQDTTMARTSYEKFLVNDSNNDLSARIRLTKLYFATHNWDKVKQQTDLISAKLNDNKLKSKIKQRKKITEDLEFILKNMDFQKDCLEHPKPFVPQNMGIAVNSSAGEYLPTMTADERTMLITCLIADSSGDFMRGQEDFYITEFENGEWQPKTRIPYPLNTEENEGAGCISPDGRFIYFTKCNSPDGFGSCDIYVSERIGKRWTYPKNLGSNVNSQYWDTQPSIASDGKTLYFVSNRPGGFGKSDIYVTRKRRDGTWTKARNLGEPINTAGDEVSPFIHPSNTTLYFASDSHLTMGGLDILYSRLQRGKFSKPENLGCPINTNADEFGLIVTPSGTHAIYSSDMAGGFGSKDLYIFELYPEAQPIPVTYIKGRVLSKATNQPLEAELQIKDLSSDSANIIAATVSDASDGSYLLCLPLGADYALSVTAKDYMLYSSTVTLHDSNDISSHNSDIYLVPAVTGAAIVLRNVFFDVDSYRLLPASFAELATLVEILNDNPSFHIEIAGHTDNTGSKQHNQTLSENRAKAVCDYLISKGISPTRLTAHGYGQEQPVASNDTDEGKAQNRRTEFRITKK
ncbi:MAG: OmpA family protein [Bacteroidales bacterium]|jgi:outer membrane protein OmpA-like peptidoglycan-associated protein|nr:OmpA family protein [Bacteroidales bacterium]